MEKRVTECLKEVIVEEFSPMEVSSLVIKLRYVENCCFHRSMWFMNVCFCRELALSTDYIAIANKHSKTISELLNTQSQQEQKVCNEASTTRPSTHAHLRTRSRSRLRLSRPYPLFTRYSF